MTDSAHPHIPLGVMRVLGDSLGLYFRRLPLFFVIVAIPMTALYLLALAVAPPRLGMDDSSVSVGWSYDDLPGMLFFLAEILVTFVATAVITLAAYDSVMKRRLRLGAYVARSLQVIVPLLVLGLVLQVIIIAGLFLLILPGLYIAARYFPVVPVILIERTGFSSLGRAAELTRGYRWPILGALILYFILILALGALVFPLTMFAVSGTITIWQFQLASAALDSLSYALGGVFTALLYARLREVKEGLGIRDLVEVFA